MLRGVNTIYGKTVLNISLFHFFLKTIYFFMIILINFSTNQLNNSGIGLNNMV